MKTQKAYAVSAKEGARNMSMGFAAVGVIVFIFELILVVMGRKVGIQIGSFALWGLPGILLGSALLTLALALVGYLLGRAGFWLISKTGPKPE